MALQGKVVAAPPGSLGFDIDTALAAADAADYRAKGFSFCVRYLSRAHPAEHAGDLTAAEADVILNAGLGLMAVQHVAAAGWRPTLALGETYGANAATNAGSVGLPAGMNVWLDLEGVAEGVAAADVIAYCNAWYGAVSSAGYVPGIYVGASAGLTGDELYFRLRMAHYWQSGSAVPAIPHRGYQLFQRIAPDDIDRNVAITDAFGGQALWLQR